MEENSTLVKFAKLNHLLQMRDEGLLYMNNLPYFWKIEDKELRGDSNDGVDEIQRGKKGSVFNKNGTKIPFTITNWNLRFLPNNPERINIFCMYALRLSIVGFPIDKRNFKFGDHALIFTKPNEFINRVSQQVRTKLIKSNYKLPESNLVEYVKENYAGEIGSFRKMESFSYQSEWRFVCFDGPGKEREIRIGNLKDISIIVPSCEINQRITIDTNMMIHAR